jgi:SYP5 family syntaxin
VFRVGWFIELVDRRAGLAMADSWTKEFQEAARVAEEIENRIAEKNALPPHSSEGTRIVSFTRRKLAVLNNKLDRLESLLQSAPLKGGLSEKELNRRQNMLTDFRYKSKQMAASLSSAQANRESLMEGGMIPVETRRTQGLENSGLVKLQRQIMREQDEDLENLEKTVHSTKHIALAVNEELDLHTRLLDDMGQSADVTNNKLLAAQRRLGFLNKNLGQGWSLMTMIFLMIVVVVLVLFLFKIL